MTLDRAIDILTQYVTRAWSANDPDLRIAIIMGLDALKQKRSKS